MQRCDVRGWVNAIPGSTAAIRLVVDSSYVCAELSLMAQPTVNVLITEDMLLSTEDSKTVNVLFTEDSTTAIY